jgi:long-chain fatty acid transport protein
MTRPHLILRLLPLAAACAAGPAWATNGYFAHGYGIKAKGMGGVATALAQDSLGGANNPASMVWVGSRIDLGVDLFSPRRSAERVGGLAGSADSGLKYFLIPEFGYNHMINSDLSLGVSVYGNGGMNTHYPSGQLDAGNCAGGAATGVPANLLCGSGPLGVNLMQLIIAPTAAYKINESHSIGISPLFGYQMFKAQGLQAFSLMSFDSSNLTNRGDSDDASGWGVRIGWQGKISPTLTLGATYSSKIDMSKFSKYQGLFAEQGDFDIPENYNVGLAFQAMPNLTVALDYQRINYSGVKSIGNPSAGLGGALGQDNGPGFGWQDINVWKLGVQYKMDDKMTLRAGYNHSENPIQSTDAMFNILAPGIVQDHVTLGMSFAVSKTSDLTVSYMHAFENSVTGPVDSFGGVDTIKMHQDSIGIAYSWKM